MHSFLFVLSTPKKQHRSDDIIEYLPQRRGYISANHLLEFQRSDAQQYETCWMPRVDPEMRALPIAAQRTFHLFVWPVCGRCYTVKTCITSNAEKLVESPTGCSSPNFSNTSVGACCPRYNAVNACSIS